MFLFNQSLPCKLHCELLKDFFDHQVGAAVLNTFPNTFFDVETNFGLRSHYIAMLLNKIPSMKFEVFHLVVEFIVVLLFPLLLCLENDTLFSQTLGPSHLVSCIIIHLENVITNEPVFVSTSVLVHRFPLFAHQVVLKVSLIRFDLFIKLAGVVLDLQVGKGWS